MKKTLLPLLVALLATPLVRAADAELLPGKIVGTVSLTSDSVKNGNIYAYAVDGSGSAQVSFTGNTYSMVVPAGKTWRLTAYIYTTVPSGSYAYLYVNLPDQIAVGADETVTHNISLTTAHLTADVQVANGTLDSIPTLQASGSTGGTGSISFNAYSQYLDYAVVLPAASVSTYGSVKVTSDTGASSSQSLASQTVAVAASGGTASWQIDASFAAGAIVGDLALVGPATPNSASINLYSGSTLVGSKSFSGNGSFQFTNLLPGSYRIYSYNYFSNAQLYIYGSANAVAGEVTTYDVAETTSLVNMGLNPTGFLTADLIKNGNVSASWTPPNPNPDALSRSANLGFNAADQEFAGVVTGGEWKFNRFSVGGYDYSEPGVYPSYALGVYYYQTPGVTFEPGVSQTLPSLSFDTTQTELTFDVIEAAGATSETLISSAQVSGYAYQYDGGQLQQQLSFSGSVSTSSPQPRQRVRIVGIPGTYNVSTYGYVDGSRVSFGNFTLELKEPLPTPTGTNVEVDAGGGVDLTFDNVLTGGVTTASQLPVGPALPDGYSVIENNGSKAYYSISTTATFDGYVDVTISYTDDAAPPELESELRLFYFDDATQSWLDITIEVDEANNLITGTAPELALFAVGVPHAPELGTVELPAEVLAGEEFTLTVDFTDVDPGESHTATIDWGDGTTSEGTVDAINQQISAAHTYAAGGTYTATITIVDATGQEVTQAFTVEATGGDDTPPVISFDAVVTAEATGPDGATVDFTISALDETDGAVAVETSPASGSVFPLGDTTVTATATDAAGNVATVEFTVTVEDTTAPTITSVTPSVGVLWPPNHKMVAIAVSVDASDLAGEVTARIVEVTSNEADSGTGKGDRPGDIEVTGDLTLNLRAERAGNGTGRVYTITVEVTDAAGNSSLETTTVSVPHDQSGKSKSSGKG